MNFGRLKARTVSEIGTYDVTADATILGELANEAVRDFLLETGVKVVTATASLTANTWEYTLDATVLAIKGAYIDGTSDYATEQVSPETIRQMQISNPSTQTGTSLYYALEGSDLLMVFPTPSAAATLKLYVVQTPTEMSSDGHDPSTATYGGIPVEHHPALLQYMFWQLASSDDDSSSGQGERYREGYERLVKRARKVTNMKGNVRLPRATVGRRRYVPSDPSRDY
jgi:hypothetical protein